MQPPGKPLKAVKVLRIVAMATCLLACLAAVTIVWATPRVIGDLYVALAAGRDVLAGKLGQPDDWSFLTTDRIWINQNWLSHLTIHVSYLIGGNLGLLVLKALLVAGLTALLTLTARRQGTDWSLALVLAGALVAGSRSFIDLRPNLFTLVLAAGLLWTVCLSVRNAHWIWLSVGVELLWSNAHGGFLFGIAVLALWAACRAISQAGACGLKAAARQCWPLAAAPIVSTLLAGTISPFGWENITHPLTVAGSEAWRTVVEWRSVFDSAGFFGTLWEFWAAVGFLMGALLLGVLVGAAWPDKRNEGAQRRFLEPSLTALCLSGVTVVAAWRIPLAADVRPYQEIVATFYSRRSTALILFGMAALVSCLAAAAAVARLRKGKEKLDVPRLGVAAFQALLAAVTISMAMGARRFIPLALVMMSPLLGQRLQWLSRRVPWLSQRAGGSLVPILAAAALIVPLARVAPKQVRHYQPNNPLFAEEDFCERMHYSRDSFGFGVTEFINANGLHGRIFEDWGWEGYLHWRCPQLKLFVGDRAQQVYTEEMFRKQEDVRNGRGAAEILAEYRIPLAAVPLANYDAFLNSTAMNPQGRWAVIYCDGQGMVLADTSYAEQADLAGRTITGQLRYPNAAAAAMSRAFCLMSPVVGAPGDQTLAAVKAANELDPIPQTYLALAPALLNKTSLQAELLVYFARENQRLATMDYHRPNGRRLLGSRIVVAEFLARCRQAEGRFAEAERLRQEAVRLKTQLESLGW